jgi:hypothetical protein
LPLKQLYLKETNHVLLFLAHQRQIGSADQASSATEQGRSLSTSGGGAGRPPAQRREFQHSLEYVVEFSPNSVWWRTLVRTDQTNNGSVLLGDGNGTFELACRSPTHRILPAAADFNGDGKPDLAATGDNRVRDCWGTATGRFSPRFRPWRCSVPGGDLNSDGKADVAVGHSWCMATARSACCCNGDGTLQPVQKFAAGYGAEFLATGTSTVTADSTGPAQCLNTGCRRHHAGQRRRYFQAAHNYIAGFGDATSIAAGDFNADARPTWP